MYWTDLEHKTIGVWGMGKEGKSAYSALQKYVSDCRLIEIDESNTDAVLTCDVLVKSPGVSIYRPEIQEAQIKGVVITSGTNLFFANKDPLTRIIAITGTKGKSTTASLLAHTLKQLGQSVALGGNIGLPLLDLLDTPTDYVVAELSSYQCSDLKGQPDIGVLLNLYPEHLQWHGTHEQYYQDKLNMIHQAEHVVLNATSEETSLLTTDLSSNYFNNISGIHIQNNFFYSGSDSLFPIEVLPLPGIHNAENACAVLTVIRLLGLPLIPCAKAFQTFTALPHRLQTIGQENGITFVDDSISTTPETAIAGLKALYKGQPITLIAGGYDRGQDYTILVNYLSAYKDKMRLVTLPDTGKRLATAAQLANIETIPTSDMPTAINVAKHITPSGGIILLSPAAPSYNMYPNFEARGDDFKRWSGI